MYSAVRLWTSVQAVIGSCLASGGAGGEDAGGGDEVGDAFNLVAPEADGGVVEAQYSSFFTQDYVGEAGDVGDGGGVRIFSAGGAQPVALLVVLEPEVLVEDA